LIVTFSVTITLSVSVIVSSSCNPITIHMDDINHCTGDSWKVNIQMDAICSK
jgi:hypothetical protein